MKSPSFPFPFPFRLPSRLAPSSRLVHAAVGLVFSGLAIPAASVAAEPSDFRPPAVPLVACDPYFSIWSQADRLTDTATTHWTGKPHRMNALVRVDGVAYRLMGVEPDGVPAMEQTSVRVLPTRTVYEFSAAGVEIGLTFTTPAMPEDVAVLSRPVTYLTVTATATGGGAPDVDFYFDARGELATNIPEQNVTGEAVGFPGGSALQIGTTSQNVLGKSGDDIRIDWGYFYLAAGENQGATLTFGSPGTLQAGFVADGAVAAPGVGFPTPAADVAAAAAVPLGKLGADPVSRHLVLAYDDLYSIEFMGNKLRPYWRRDGWEASDLLAASVAEYRDLSARCAALDAELMDDLGRLGGEEYAEIGALAYRQCFAAGKFVADANGQPLQFSKENHSNGCMATSDVFYPMMPQFLLFGPSLAKSVLAPFMEYAASDRWKFPFAPHDLGTYPKANGQRYGGGETSEENQMPVEESGNLLILFAALAKMEGNADFADRYWPQLSQWAAYLEDKGFDPENQLCTDDFAGHMAHNVNLSAKAICGLGAYAKLCRARGNIGEAEQYEATAQKFAAQWVEAADNGDHFRLAFDRPGTWSQKYNLVWDRILGLGLFPDRVLETEMAFYRKVQNEFGLPLDNRSDYTKLDWILWTACLTGERDDFDALVNPVHRFLHVTPDRSPMTDWYFTSTARKRGFTARPVVGGVFLRTLYDDDLWQKYASRDVTKAAGWAPMPVPPKTVTLVATGADAGDPWRFTTSEPDGDWHAEAYDDSAWSTGKAGFGTDGTPGARIGTRWDTEDLWVRRTFTVTGPVPDRVGLRIHHDEGARVFINGTQVAELWGYTTGYELTEIPPDALRTGENTLAIHCHQTTGGQYLDCGIDAILPGDNEG